MSLYSTEVTLATSALCAAGGAMGLPQLYRSLQQRCSIPEQNFYFIVEHCPRFALLPRTTPGGPELPEDCFVLARTSLRLCRKYLTDECAGCQDLHLCKYYLYGNCKFTPGRKSCRFSHNIHSDHNSPLLRECTLHELNEEELFLLLLQNDHALLPEVCLYYNKGLGQHGNCTFQDNCTKVHLCLHFIQGLCLFGHKCKRQHAIGEKGRCMLEGRGLSGGLINKLPTIYLNSYRLRQASSDNSPDSLCQHFDTMDSGDICLHFIRNNCKFQEKCELVHFHLPYRWQVFRGNTWWDLHNMENIEQAYCDPSITKSADVEPIDFVTMIQGTQPVRRLSTVSSVKRPCHYTLTTEWLWFYKEEHEKWVEYGQPDDKQRTTSVTSRNLEEAYLSNKTEVSLVKGQRQYIVTFKDMYQRNPKRNTKRSVRRRPRFISPYEVKRLAAQK